MSVKKAMPVLILAILFAMTAVWKMFQRDGNTVEQNQQTAQVITLLACYEIKEQQDIFVQLAKEYSGLREGVQVEVKFIDREDLKKELCLGVDSGEKPELVICGSMEMAGLMGMGVLENVEEELVEEIKSRLLYPELLQSAISMGNCCSLPFSLDPYVMFSNPKYVQKAGTAWPRTWEEMLEACSSIDGSGISSLGFGVKHTGAAADLFRSMIYTCGGNFYDLSEEPGVRALTIFDTLKKHGDINKNVINCTEKDMAREFAGEKIAFLIAPVSTRVWLDKNGSVPEYQIGPLPGEAREGFVLSGDSLGFCRGASQEAEQFGAYLYTWPVRKRILSALGTLPLLSGDEEVLEEDSVRMLNREFMEKGTGLETYYSWFEMSDVLSAYFYDILAKKNVDLWTMAAGFQDEMRVAIMSYFQ